MLQAGFLKHR